MRGLSFRVFANLLVFALFTAGMIVLGFVTFASGFLFDRSYEVTATIPDAGGVLPRQEVTVMGRAVGTVTAAELVEDGVQLTFEVQRQFSVPERASLRILRRSPVGEQAVDLMPDPGTGWTAAAPGSAITVTESRPSTTVQSLLDNTVDLFQQVDARNAGIVIRELAIALEGRASIIRELNTASIDLGETLLSGQEQFRRLLDTSEPLLETLNQHADDLIDLFDSGATLADVFAENRPNLDRLLDTAPYLLGQAEALVVNVRANAQCLVSDLIAVNEMLLGPSTMTGVPAALYGSKLDELQMAIDKHRFFFQLGIPLTIQNDPETGMGWARVRFMLDHLGSGDLYDEPRPTPPTRPGAACVSPEWGTGVNAVRQPNHQPADPTSPGILWAPLVPETGPGPVAGPTRPPSLGGPVGSGPGTPSWPLPATGGSLAAIALIAILAASLLMLRRR